ncbi:MAG: arginine--tRNA ligase [Candidatus Flexifilum sp.]
MILIPQELARLIAEAVAAAQTAGALPAFELPPVEVRTSRHAAQGDYSYAAMPLARAARLAPLAIAERIRDHLPASPLIGRVEAVAPGYVNLFLSEDWIKQQVDTLIAEGDRFYQLTVGQGKRAQVEFVSANPTAPLHIGRSRGAIVGDAVARVLEAAGWDVQREYYFNNAGAQMRNLGNSLRIRYLQALGRPVTVEDEATFYQGSYLIDFAHKLIAEVGDAWAERDYQPFKEYAEAQMFEMIKATLRRVDIIHDAFFNENSLYDSGAVWEVLHRLEERGFIYRSVTPETDNSGLDEADEDAREQAAAREPATWFRSTRFGDSKDRVLVKSTGEPTYTLPDIAYHVNKLERGFDLAVNVLGADHYVQHQVVKYGLQALGYDAARVHVIIIQLVALLKNGQPVRMSSRKGDFETLDDLIDQTSPDAVRYVLLARSPDTHLNFDIDLAVKQSNENPVYYIQYAHVRCAGIMREAAARGLTDDGADLSLLGADELRFLKKAFELGEVIEQAARTLEAYRVAFYTLELAQIFHPIFDSVRVLHSEVPPEVARARLRFYRAAQVVFRRALRLMGMSAPDHM